jgi:hypothetical protein
LATKSSVFFLVICAGGLAAYSGWKIGDELFLRSAEAAFAKSGPSLDDTAQMSNRDAKRDRDVVAAKPAEALEPDAPVLAFARIEPEPAVTEPQPATTPALQLASIDVAPPPPAAKPKVMAKIEKIGRALLSDYQITGIKQRLTLTAAQERYWPAVEKALRGLSERVVEYRKNLNKSNDGKFNAEAAQVEQLKAAALPLMTQLRDDQKSTVLMIASMAGLGSVMTEMFSGNEVASNNN